MKPAPDINDSVQRLKSNGDSFAVATVVRTLSVTAAKPGAKAIINQSGEIVEGWIGGGCARSAVVKAATRSIVDGEPRFVSIHPDDVLQEQGMDKGESLDGRWIASNMCPSKGSMEIFIEPFLANPELVVVGATPVAESLCQMAVNFNFAVALVGKDTQACASESEFQARPGYSDPVSQRYDSWDVVPMEHQHRYIIVATQGAKDLSALSAALKLQSRHIGFVGSRRKIAHLKSRLEAKAFDAQVLARIKAPAGLDIGAVTPQEIALSILAELVQIRRKTSGKHV